ncbi:MAG: hypothetical protein ABIQ89_02650 [Candidatus Saccharimonadales bacterium]
MSKTDKQLGNSKSDWSAIVAKASLGAVPIAGSFLSEIVSALIPNQRIERIAKFANELNTKLEKLPDEVIKKLRDNELFIDLVEDSFFRTVRASSEERRRYILNIVQNGISEDDATINNAKYLLGLLSEINDNEVIWLRYFHERTLSDKSKFQSLHKNILSPVQVVLGSHKEERQRGAIQESYKEHLLRLGLIRDDIKMNKDLGVPEYDSFTNKPKVSYSEATTLGNMLLEKIGLIETKVELGR